MQWWEKLIYVNEWKEVETELLGSSGNLAGKGSQKLGSWKENAEVKER